MRAESRARTPRVRKVPRLAERGPEIEGFARGNVELIVEDQPRKSYRGPEREETRDNARPDRAIVEFCIGERDDLHDGERRCAQRATETADRSEPRKNRARDIALEALQRLRDLGDVPRLRPMPPRGDDRRADARSDDEGVGTLERGRRVVDHHAVIALGVLRQGQEFLRAQQLLRMRRGCAGDEERQARHDIEGDRRQFSVAVGQRLDQPFGLRINAKERGKPGLSQVGVDKKRRNGHLRERKRQIGGEICDPDPRVRTDDGKRILALRERPCRKRGTNRTENLAAVLKGW